MVPSPNQLTDYENVLANARLAKSQHPIGNRFPWHAKVAIRELLEFAHSQNIGGIRFISDSFSNFVYDNSFCKLVFDYARNVGDVRAIFIGPQLPTNSLFISTLLECGDIRVTQTESPGKDFQHFFVIGKEAYRLEKGHAPYDASNVSPISPVVASTICFSDPQTGEILHDRFEAIWENSLQVQASPNWPR